MLMPRLLVLLLLLLLPITQLQAELATESDNTLELQWQEQLVDNIVVGDIVWLKGYEERPFIGIHAEAGDTPKGTVILMHNMTGHPNWPAIISPLRRGLLEHGWSTLSLQMPVLDADCGGREHAVLLHESPARLDAAVQYLNQQGEQKIVLLGHGLGAIMGAAFLAEHGRQDIKGLVAVGMYMLRYTDPRMYVADYLDKVKLPILDIFGSADVLVANAKKERAFSAGLGGNRKYQQLEVAGADMWFTDHEEVLMAKLRHWLDTLK